MSAFEFASVFAGIGGFDKGFEAAGVTPTAQVEWNKHCQTILRRHYPNTNLMGDICDVRGTDLGRPTAFVAGFPCQDTSIAAPDRLGLAGKRSGQFFQFVRLLDEYQRLIDECGPRFVVLENPVGLLSSPGKPGKNSKAYLTWDGIDRTGWDMAAVVRGLEDLGYGWAYRVVDGRRLGTPQRRNRVIVVGHRGGDPRPAWLVLGDPEGRESADPARPVSPRWETRPTAAGVAPRDLVVWRKSARPRAALSKGGYETWIADGDSNTLAGFDGGGAARQTHLLVQNGRLRTLTPLEWERLQGFDDGWTEGIPVSARYDALGNAMHVGMATWLAHRLVNVHKSVPAIGAAA